MSTKLNIYLTTVLILIWALDIWQQGLLQTDGAARYWRRYGAALGLTYVLISKSQWALAFAFTASALTWSKLPDTTSKTAGSLPSFNKFMRTLPDAQLQPITVPPATEDTPNDVVAEEPTCIVCWSSSVPPKVLPCTHLICTDCLANIKASTQNNCPLCRLPLFTRSNALMISVYRGIASLWNADFLVRTLAVTLQIYKGEIWTRTLLYDVMWLSWEAIYALWTRKMILEGGGDWWRTPSFSRLEGDKKWWWPVGALLLLVFNLSIKIWEISELDEDIIVIDK